MRFSTTSLAAATALALMCGAAQAGEFKVDAKTTAIGVGMICNTSDQAEQFVALRAGGAKASDALARVTGKRTTRAPAASRPSPSCRRRRSTPRRSRTN